jgi:hypothetical protein
MSLFRHHRDNRPSHFSCFGLAATLLFASSQTGAASEQPAFRVIVNSPTDQVRADGALTLREAIELTNGTRRFDQLSPAEAAQVESLAQPASSRIEFNLPPDQTTIRLREMLPALTTAGLTIDGTMQPGYDATSTAGEIPAPIVAITPAPQIEVLRGLTITADRVTVRGLSLYGFTAAHDNTASTPPADIFISHPLPLDRSFPLPDEISPQNVVIENNWIGIAPGESETFLVFPRSAFGVSVFNGVGTLIRRNRIANHDGSGIITAVRAENSQIRENAIETNGIAGMPDAIRLEGRVNNTHIESNRIFGNAGSAVFLFKPEGSVVIRDNQITGNGRRLRRAAIYLLGNGHQVTGNSIADQPGAGVVVGAFPRSSGNVIQNNRFARLTGLSIDLNTQLNVAVESFQQGDGINPPRNSSNRRQETGNGAIDAPQFLSPEFFMINGTVHIDGTADPGTQIELYRVNEPGSQYGILSESIAITETDAEGRFSFTLDNLQPGTVVSATATDLRYGTSEPALNAVIRAVSL